MSEVTASLLPWADPAFLADPYPHYHLLRERAPVYRDPMGIWLLSRHADVIAGARGPRLGKDFSAVEGNRVTELRGGPDSPLISEFSRWMLYKDPPDHLRLRTLVTRAFTPRTVERMRASIATVVTDLLAPVAERGRMDVVAEFAYILPVRVICGLLGLPMDESDECRAWAESISRALEPFQSQETVARANSSVVEVSEYVRGHIARRRNRPGDDLLSELLAVEEAGDRLTEAELVSTVNLLFFAGHFTTRDLIGNGLQALLGNPGELRRLRSERSLARNAVEELLRFDAPAQMVPRWALEDLGIGGCAIRRNEQVSLLLGAANRDPARFSDPDRLDLGRADAAAHISFGGGAHFCLGAALSRLEAQIAIPALAGLPGLEPEDGEPDWRPQVALRSLKTLHVTFRPHARAPRPARMNQGGRAAPRSADPGVASARPERMSVRAPDGTEIAVFSAGAGPPLLFVHGMGGDHSRWDPLRPFFEGRFRVHALDRRGRGSSGDGLPYSVSKEAADIAAVIEALGSSVAVVAHSFGALCTAEAALSTTSIGRLVLYEPPFLCRTDGLGTSDLDDLERLVAEGLRSEALRRFMQVRVQMSPHDIEVLAALPSWESRKASAHTLVREIRALSDYEFDEVRWAGVGIPVLLLMGDRSLSHLIQAARRLDRALPDSTVVVLPGQGHVAMDTDLESFVRAVREFVA